MPLSIKVKANKNISGIYANGGWCLHNHKLQPFPLFRLGMVSGFFGLASCFGYCPFWPAIWELPRLLGRKSQLQIANSTLRHAIWLAVQPHPFRRIFPHFSEENLSRGAKLSTVRHACVSLRQDASADADADAVDALTARGGSKIAPKNRLPLVGEGGCFDSAEEEGRKPSGGWLFASRVACGYFMDPDPKTPCTPTGKRPLISPISCKKCRLDC